MSRLLQWVLGICAILLTIAVVVSAVFPLFGVRGAYDQSFGPGHMFDGRMFGGGMMGGFGMPFFGFGMFLWPLLFVGIVIVGIVLLVRDVARPRASQPPMASQPPVATTPCANCGRPLYAGWVACPYCGEKVTRNA